MKISHMPMHLRPREKLLEKGPHSLKDSELIAILFRTGRKGKNAVELADQVLKLYPLYSLSKVNYKELMKLKGIDKSKICTLLAALEMVHRVYKEKNNILPCITTPAEASNQVAFIKSKKKEYFVALYLNARNQLIHTETVSIGSLVSSIVHPREVFEPAVRHSAAFVLVAHNHPSGETSPSDQDIQITTQLIEAGKILNIEFIDHLIVTEKSFLSLKEEGFI